MQPIIAPIKPGESGTQVANLQDALFALLEGKIFRPVTAPHRPTQEELHALTEDLKQERERSLFGKATQQLIMYLQVQQRLGDILGGVVEDKTADLLNRLLTKLGLLQETPINEFIVKGMVIQANGNLAMGLVVRAFDRDLRKFEQLGKDTVAGTDGRYEIPYSSNEFSRAEKGSPDLVIRVYPPDAAADKFLVESPTLFNAPAVAEINLPLPDTSIKLAEFENHVAAIAPLLAGQAPDGSDLQISALTDADVDFIVGETNIDRQHIAWLIQAAGFEEKSKTVDPTILTHVVHRFVPAAAFYAWFRQGLTTDWEVLISQSASLLKRALLAAVKANIVQKSLEDQADQIVERLPSAHRRNLTELGVASGLTPAVLTQLTRRLDNIDRVGDNVLSRLVKDNVLTDHDASAFGLGVSLQRLTGFDTRAVAALRELLPKDGEGAVHKAPDLVRLDFSEWSRLLHGAHAGGATDDLSIPTLARNLEADIAEAFPKAAFEFRLTRLPAGIEQHIERLQPVLVENGPNGSASDASPLSEARAVVTQLANLHPGLSLLETIRKADSPTHAAAAVSERIGWMRKVFDINQGVDFLSVDLTPDSTDLAKIRFDGLADDAKRMVLNNLKTHQRLHAVTDNVVTSGRLMMNACHSAAAVSRVREADLVGMGLTLPDAREAVNRAREITNKAAHLWFGAHTLFRDTKTTPFRPSPTANEFFAKLPGYAELFGEQSFCRCEHCQSVLSPAAYFVDLMRYIERNILTASFAGKENHPLNLKIRRPDLWTLPLTCDNTNKYIPYLVVINEVLETFIQSQKPGDFYRDLSKADNSLRQPFHWPTERLATYLEHFKTSRFDIAKRIYAGPDGQVRARLGLSLKEYEIVTSSRVSNLNADAAYFEKLFRVTQVPRNSADAALDRQNLQDLLQATGLSRDLCASVLTSSFVNAVGSANAKIKIIAGVSNPAQNVQNDKELVEQLSLRRLDRISRFIRLWRRLSWTVSELDAVLEAFRASAFATDIDPAALRGIVEILAAQDVAKLDVDETLAMAGNLPTTRTRDAASLFDRRFNPASFTADGPWPAPGVRYVHAAMNTAQVGVSLPDARATHRLLSALQVSDQDLVDLIGELITPLFGNATTLASATNSFELSAENLSLLYRHARVARILGVSAKDLFTLIRLTPEIVAPSNTDAVKRIRSVSDLLAVVRFQQWQKNCGFRLEEIAYLIGGPVITDATTPESLASEFRTAVAVEKSLEFVDAVFTQVGLSEQQSHKFVVDNSKPGASNQAFEPSATAGMYRLVPVFDPEASLAIANLIVDPLITVPDIREKVRNVLRGYSAWALLKARLSAKLALSPERVNGLLALLRSSMSVPDATGVIRAIQGGLPVVLLESLLGNVLRYAILLKSPVFTPQTLRYLATQKQTFALRSSIWTSPAEVSGSLSVESIQRIATYVQLANIPDRSFTGAGAEPDILALHASIDAIASGQPPVTADQLAAALRVDKARLIPLLANLPMLPLNALERLAAVRKVLDLIGDLGLNGETLRLIASDDYDELSRAADGTLAAFRAKYADEKSFLEKVEPFEDKLRGRKRDALVDYITTEWRLPFASQRSLYEYFLLDVELGGCARTSRIVAANSSLQLYVQRVLMNLERSEDGKVNVSFGDMTQTDVKEHIAEWTWRKNYRVWEANRKVFLYPENYIEPELRDDKSHIFKELEDTLLQQQIGEQTILDAYAKYLAGFEELANLTIAGVHLEYRSEDSRLHVFAASSSDPPTFYYRVVDALDSERPIFGNWSKVNVQIPVKKVSLVVYLGQLYVFWVTITTRSETAFVDGNSQFIGYIHKISVFYSVLRLDDSWSAPQRLSIRYSNTARSAIELDSAVTVSDPTKDKGEDLKIASPLPWLTISVPTTASFTPRYDKVMHTGPIEGYTLRGDQWEVAYPSVKGDELLLTLRNFRMTGVVDVGLNVYAVSPGNHTDIERGLLLNGEGKVFEGYTGASLSTLTSDFAARSLPLMSPAAQVDVKEKDKGALEDFKTVQPFYADEFDDDSYLILSLTETNDIRLVAASGIVNDAVLSYNQGDAYLVHQLFKQEAALYRLHRLSTTVSLRSKLGKSGVHALLSLGTQRDLHETSWALPPSATLLLGDKFHPLGNRDPFIGAYGSYMAEIFFQVPFLMANHLNSQQMFAAAQRWYHYIFNPTATDNPSYKAYRPDNSVVETDAKPGDRPWRYLGFRNLMSVGLREMLKDEKALAAYKNDPFNPHAIARLRPSAYQKSIVMKYIDNLLDWGDQLFAQFTIESVAEATMLYVMASDILGPRAAELGECGEDSVTRNYQEVAPYLDAVDEFLVELEPLAVPIKMKRTEQDYVFEVRRAEHARGNRALLAGTRSSSQPMIAAGVSGGGESLVEMNWNKPTGGYWSSTTGTPLSHIHGSEISESAITGIGAIKTVRTTSIPGATNGTRVLDANILDNFPPVDVRYQDGGELPDKWQPSELVPSKLLFCIPDNKELRAYWDRVDDRLFKIRNCMDIAGVRRRLELFAPEIDPRMLVRLKAAGLSIEDVLTTTSGDVPPHRFAYLIDKAKQYAATVQAFGSQLISVIEKRDTEELNRLRLMHEQNLIKMREQAVAWEVTAAEDTLESLHRQKVAAEYRRDHYIDLAQAGLCAPEFSQLIAQTNARDMTQISSLYNAASSVAYLVPQIGAFTAMKYGGKELGDAFHGVGSYFGTYASASESESRLASLQATFYRRNEEWKHQSELAKRDLDQIAKQIAAAAIRKQIAENAKNAHQKTLDQTEEVYALYASKFSNLGRYTWLSTKLHRLYRMAFNSAFSMARLVEQAYRFERDDDVSATLLDSKYWEAENAGLLAGDQLLLDLQTMERRFIETNYRKLEITQSFSVAQFAPDKLIELRENGTCTFTVPEVFFDLYYPGHYKRAIKAVRLTIPCIVGPYTNVGATLRLKSCKIRKEAKTIASVTTVPLRHTVSVAISSAQNDAGVFEFGFRDERYMPFEGAGAIDSEWEITLPNQYRSFDYNTISDVILHISYTASEDTGFRAEVDAQNGQLMTMLRALPPKRLFNIRSEFPTAWAKFKNQQPFDTSFAELKIDLGPQHYPFWSQGKLNSLVKAELYARTTLASLVVAKKSDGTGTDAIAESEGKLLKGELINNKPQSPVGVITLYLSDNSMEELWLVISWSE